MGQFWMKFPEFGHIALKNDPLDLGASEIREKFGAIS